MDSSNPLIRHISLEKLKRLIREEKNKHVFQRLLFIHQLYLEDGVEKACKRMCISKQTGYNWLNQWNEQGYEGINPNFGGGRPPKLTKKQKEQLKEKLKSKGAWLTPEVRALIRNDFKIVQVYKACGHSGAVNLKGNGGSDSEVQSTKGVGSYWLLKRE